MQRPDREKTSIWPIIILIGLAFVLGMGLWFAIYWATKDWEDAPDLLISLGNAGLTLAFGGILGGLVRLLFDAWADRAAHRDATQTFYRNILNDLKSVYDDVERVRLLVEAHKSAKTYGAQMRALPDAITRLRNIKRALEPGFETLKDELEPVLVEMIEFLDDLMAEFRDNYLEVSRLQSLDEAINRQRRDAAAKDPAQAGTLQISARAWARIETLEKLKILRQAQSRDENDPDFKAYKAAFLRHLDKASAILRARLE